MITSEMLKHLMQYKSNQPQSGQPNQRQKKKTALLKESGNLLLIVSALLVGSALLTGCASKRIHYVEVRTECELPSLPVLPVLSWDELMGTTDALKRLEEYEAKLIDSLNVHREMLRIICQPAQISALDMVSRELNSEKVLLDT